MENYKDKHKAYIGPYLFPKGGGTYWYIHEHKKNIGKANNSSAENDSSLAAIYKNYKDQAQMANKFYYQSLFKGSLDVKSTKLLEEAFANDDIFTELDKQLTKKIQEAVPTSGLEAIYNASFSLAEQKIATQLTEATQSTAAFNTLLDTLAKTCELFKSEAGANLAALLLKQKTDGALSLSEMGGRLLAALDAFASASDGALFGADQMDHVAKQIRPLANALSKETTSSGGTLSNSAIKKMIDDIFSTGFTEAMSSIMDAMALSNSDGIVSAALTGAKQTEAVLTGPDGKELSISELKSLGLKKRGAAAGKADVMFNNVKIDVSLDGGQTTSSINIDIGLSDKMYRSAGFYPKETKDNAGSFSSGSGGSIAEALVAISTDQRFLYLSYNVLASGAAIFPGATEALQDIILRRQITRLFASRNGQADLTQFMLINGRVVSIWEIIQKVMETENLGKTSSMGGENQAVTLSLGESRKEMIAKGQLKDELERTQQVNYAAAKGAITAHLNLKAFLGLI